VICDPSELSVHVSDDIESMLIARDEVRHIFLCHDAPELLSVTNETQCRSLGEVFHELKACLDEVYTVQDEVTLCVGWWLLTNINRIMKSKLSLTVEGDDRCGHLEHGVDQLVEDVGHATLCPLVPSTGRAQLLLEVKIDTAGIGAGLVSALFVLFGLSFHDMRGTDRVQDVAERLAEGGLGLREAMVGSGAARSLAESAASPLSLAGG
jgi:hypothetical protein